MSTNFNFAGKKVLVTGASQGIGRSLSVTLCKAGAQVYAMARNAAALESLAAEAGPSLHVLVGDVSADAATLEAAIAPHGPFNYLVNNAGIATLEPAISASEQVIKDTMTVNWRGAVFVSQIVAKGMRESGGGSIVNLSSQAGILPFKDHLVYCCSKAAMDMATRCMALEWGEWGIRVNSVNPTVVMTDMGKKNWSDPAKAATLLNRMPIRRFATEDDVVNSVLFLLSDASAMTTGSVLPVDGGTTTV